MKVSRDIDQALRADMREYFAEIRVALMGPKGSGKGTLLRHFELLSGPTVNHTEADLLRYSSLVRRFLLFQLGLLFGAASTLGQELPPQLLDLVKDDQTCRGPEDPMQSILEPTRSLVETARTDEQLREALRRSYCEPTHCRSIGLYPFSLEYFLDRSQEILLDGYWPTYGDIIRISSATIDSESSSAVHDRKLVWRDEATLTISKLSNGDGSIRKWAHMLSEVQLLIYTIAVDEYDDLSEGGLPWNGAVEVIRSIMEAQYLRTVNVGVFLNRSDQFSKKLLVKPLQKVIPEFVPPEDGKNLEEAAKFFVVEQFQQTNPDPRSHRLFVGFIDSTNPDDVQFSWRRWGVLNPAPVL